MFKNHFQNRTFYFFQTSAMTDYLNNIEYESIVAIAVQDSGGGIAFDDVAAAVMESLGAGTNDCPVHIGKFSLLNKLFHCHRCEILNSSC